MQLIYIYRDVWVWVYVCVCVCVCAYMRGAYFFIFLVTIILKMICYIHIFLRTTNHPPQLQEPVYATGDTAAKDIIIFHPCLSTIMSCKHKHGEMFNKMRPFVPHS